MWYCILDLAKVLIDWLLLSPAKGWRGSTVIWK